MLLTLDELKRHPFTLISLADREKFHTGMVAYVLQKLVERSDGSASELLKTLWALDSLDFETDGQPKISIAVEQQSIDLMVLVEQKVHLAAEFKLKTTLSSHQLESYRKKFPKAKFVVLGLFPEPIKFNDISWRSFPDVALNFFDSPEKLDEFERHVSNDEAALVRMWLGYLRSLNNLSQAFQSLGLGPVDRRKDVVIGLSDIKLRGLFESYRYRLVSELLNTPDDLSVEPFNSNGNAGLNLEFAARFPLGLQWQAGALKLFSKDYNYTKGEPTNQRDDFLERLCRTFCEQSELEVPAKMSKPGQFRSFTVIKWNIFDDCNQSPERLSNYLHLIQKLIAQLDPPN